MKCITRGYRNSEYENSFHINFHIFLVCRLIIYTVICFVLLIAMIMYSGVETGRRAVES